MKEILEQTGGQDVSSTVEESADFQKTGQALASYHLNIEQSTRQRGACLRGISKVAAKDEKEANAS
jgi:hypothetical protein